MRCKKNAPFCIRLTPTMKLVLQIAIMLLFVGLIGMMTSVAMERFTPLRPSKRTIKEYDGPVRKDQSIFVSEWVKQGACTHRVRGRGNAVI